MFEVAYLCNGWVKKDGVKAIGPTLVNPIDFAFSPRLTEKQKQRKSKLKVNSLIKKKININLQLMSNKAIPFQNEIKLIHSDFCYYGIYYSKKDRQGGSYFYFIF